MIRGSQVFRIKEQYDDCGIESVVLSNSLALSLA